MNRILFTLSILALTSCTPKSNDVQSKLINSSIINGTEVKKGDKIASSIVAVLNVKSNFICTGSLIAPNIVMTAAHCAPEKASNVKIIFSNDIDDTMNSRELDVIAESVLPATDFRVSPVWNPKNETVETNTGDIALIKFKGSIPQGYKPATFLTNNDDLKIGNLVTVAGFGVDYVDTIEVNPKKIKNLSEAILSGEVFCDDPSNKNGKCYQIEKTGDGILRTTEAPIAFVLETEVRLNEKKSGTCNGDSGGPAFIKKNGEFFLFGVTSRGSELCNEIGVYTNALQYETWITETIKVLK